MGRKKKHFNPVLNPQENSTSIFVKKHLDSSEIAKNRQSASSTALFYIILTVWVKATQTKTGVQLEVGKNFKIFFHSAKL